MSRHALCWGHESLRHFRMDVARARSLVGHPGLPFSRGFWEGLALGGRFYVGSNSLLDGLVGEGLVHQAEGIPGRGLPRTGGLIALLHPGSLPLQWST